MTAQDYRRLQGDRAGNWTVRRRGGWWSNGDENRGDGGNQSYAAEKALRQIGFVWCLVHCTNQGNERHLP